MVIDEKSEDHLAAWGVATQPHWLDVIDRTGTLLRWMSSELIEDRNRATNLLRHVVRNAPGRAATLLWPFLEFGPDDTAESAGSSPERLPTTTDAYSTS